MGQTLTHGVYLPDEGERNCYSGLAANWQILDNSVGTIASHTTQIAGKANAVHTHTKSDITDFPAYGNAAGTICEGNDSRLSDARTPVAHTHTKSDITDLLNSNFIPSANNSYDLGSSSYQWNNLYANKTYTNTIKAVTGSIVIQSNGTDKNIGIYNGDSATDGGGFWAYGKDHSNGSLCRMQIYNTSKSRYERVDLTNSQFFPVPSGEIDLGSSSYQWNNLYAKNYYYNGVAWGLDKANVWTNTNTFQQNITYERTNFFHQSVNPCYILKDTELEKGNIPSAAHAAYVGNWQDKNATYLGYVRFVEYDTGKQAAEIRLSNLIKNGTVDPMGNTVSCTVKLELQPSGEKSLIPEQDNDIALGTSTNKWKTLNGINPGALSFPDPNSSNIVDFSTTLNDITKETATASKFSWTATVTGWMTIVWYVRNLTPPHRVAVYTTLANHDGDGRYHTFGTSFATSVADYFLFSSFPAVKGVKYWFETSFSNTTDGIIYHAYLLPCLGNV